MAEQPLCSNPRGNNFVEGKIWDHPSKTTQECPKLGGWVIWASGKRRGFSPGAAARLSQHARVYTEFVQKNTFFFIFPSSAYTTCVMYTGLSQIYASSAGCSQMAKKKARIRFWCKKECRKKFEFSRLNLTVE